MATPSQSQLYRPILEISEGVDANATLSHRDYSQRLIKKLSLTKSDLDPRLASGSTRFEKNMRWAVYSLKVAGLLDAERRGEYRITDEGRSLLKTIVGDITHRQLLEMSSKMQGSLNQEDEDDDTLDTSAATSIPEIDEDMLPEEMIEAACGRLADALTTDLLDTLKDLSGSPHQFEQVVVDLLSAMGYGDGRRIGRSGDGGVDGVIYQDPLELEIDKQIYIQAKCWSETPVRVDDVRGFSGSIGIQGATKGVFITTSDFTRDAKQAAKDAIRDNKTIMLINGRELARLMVKYDVGVVTETIYEVKKLDENYFAEEI